MFIDAIYVGGVNILRVVEDAWDTGDGKLHYRRIDADRLNQKLSEELVVPIRALRITYTMEEATKVDELRIPMGWTVRKEAAV